MWCIKKYKSFNSVPAKCICFLFVAIIVIIWLPNVGSIAKEGKYVLYLGYLRVPL